MNQPRLWPAAVLALLTLLALALVWGTGDRPQQQNVTLTMVTLALAGLLLFLWFVAFSRLAARVRVAGALAVVAAVAAFFALFRVRGFSGDLVPVVESRWSAPPSLPMAPVTTPAAPIAEAPAPSSVPEPSGGNPEAGAAPASAAAAVAEPPAVAAPAPAPAPGWPQFMGPNRDATLPGPRLADFASRAPRRLWSQPIGTGWSGFAVRDGLALTLEQRGDEEALVAYEAETGKVRWMSSWPAHYTSGLAGDGPRSTPTIDGAEVFAIGARGTLSAHDLASGRRLWMRDTASENGATLPEWGVAGSPLVRGELVIVNPGGPGGRSLVAYDRRSGERVWSGGDDRASYSSPFVARLLGREQVVIWNATSVTGHDPDSGSVLWRQEWTKQGEKVSKPLALGEDGLLVSAGYGVGAKRFRLAADGGAIRSSLVWESPRLKAKFTNVVLHEGFLYGLDDGVLTCVDPESGERRWRAGRYGHGQVILVGGQLLVMAESGELVLVEPRPDAHVERARVAVLDGKTWNPPALAGDLLLVRNDKEAAAWRLATE
ncbi:MAG: PQQ-binding-like beta-propeller repeat protein [Vicinamibacteria bacterium]|jgi:outer membrane protein assembly factor BamB|nr:PQQ-binding-like beta-propeller repeat protein [Vicinamibacteria bacterium]